MTPTYLAKLALSRLPKPYTDEVILHVFCEIERTPHLRKAYDKKRDKVGNHVNRQIGKAVSETLSAQSDKGRMRDIESRGICQIVDTVTRLADFDADWSWSHE